MAKPSITEHDVLLVIDVQNDFCPGGTLAVPDGDAVVSTINSMMDDFHHVVLTQDWHPAGHGSFASSHEDADPFSTKRMHYGPQTLWPDHCIQGTDGARFHENLNVDRAELILRKGFRPAIDSYSAFFENDQTTPTGLTGYLKERNIERVFCCGLATDFCVRYSAEDARKQGFDTVVIEEACRAIDLDGSLAAARQAMLKMGVELG